MTLKHALRILLALSLCALSCEREAQQLPQENTVLRLQAPSSSAVSKTWMDALGEGATAPVYWSAGDRVVVNGVVSSPLEADPGAKLTSASFFLTNVKAPFKVVYPHSAYAGEVENGILLDLPSTQLWKEGSFAEGSALLYGETSSEESPVQMQPLCGAIMFTLKDEGGVKASSLSITSLSEGKPLAGKFSLSSGESVQLTPSGDNSFKIDMELPEGGLAITSGGTPFIFSLPAGDYPDGFVIRLIDENKHNLRLWWLRPSEGAEAGVTLGAGHLVVFTPQVYAPDAREICSAEDWREFSAAYNAGGDGWQADWLCKDGTIKIGEDFTAESLTGLNDFADILDGCGHTVTINKGTTPLVKNLTGTIRNLTIAGTNTPSDPSTAGATIFVTNLSGGTLDNCCNKADLVFSTEGTAVIAGTFVRTFTAGSVIGCVNEGTLDISCDLNLTFSDPKTENHSRYLIAGGIVALVKDLSTPVLIKDCVNKGKVSVLAVKGQTVEATPAQAGYGGIVGSIISGTEENYLRIESCVNEGSISADFSPVPSAPTAVAATGVGGIVGAAMKYHSRVLNYNPQLSDATFFNWWTGATSQVTNQDGLYFEMVSCTSKGNVHNGFCSKVNHGEPQMDFAAGLVGIANGLKSKHVLIEDCTVKDITIEACPKAFYTRSAFCMVSGGLAGFAGYVDFKDCTVSGCEIGSKTYQTYSVAGGIGMAMMTFSMEGCKISSNLYHIRSQVSSKPYIDGHSAMGFVMSTKKGPSSSNTAGEGGLRNTCLNPDGSSVTGCSFGGSITVNPTLVEYNKTPASSLTLQKTTLDSGNFDKKITCETFTTDYYSRGIPSMVTISNNQYWDGQ